jgi:hypothetical protein
MEQPEVETEDPKLLVEDWRQRLAAGEEPSRDELRKVLSLIRLHRTVPAAKPAAKKSTAPVRSPSDILAGLRAQLTKPKES